MGLCLMMGMLVSAALFWLWSIVLLLIYVTAFARGARRAQQAWQAADAAVEHTVA